MPHPPPKENYKAVHWFGIHPHQEPACMYNHVNLPAVWRQFIDSKIY